MVGYYTFNHISNISILVSNLFLRQSELNEFLFHEDSQNTGVWKYYGVYQILRCLSKYRCLEYICTY